MKIKKRIHALDPTSAVNGEEGGRQYELDVRVVYNVDPIDGTKDFT